MPAFPVSVPMEFWKEVASVCGEPYADSYLYGATLHGGKLLPRTVTAWERLRGDHNVRALLTERGVTLLKPPPFEGSADVSAQPERRRA